MKLRLKSVFRSLPLLIIVCLLAAGGVAQDSAGHSETSAFQASARLPNGLELLFGQPGDNTPSYQVWLRDRNTGQISQLSSRLNYARAGETATVLADGTVAIIGGIGADGNPVGVVEKFDPATEEFTVASVSGIRPRYHHTATLLSDGEVLIAGGILASGEVTSDAQLWNPRTGAVSSVSGLTTPRQGHRAELLSNGTVLIQGGMDAVGKAAQTAETYDPQLQQFAPVANSADSSAREAGAIAIALAGTIPVNGTTGVPLDTIISLRFSGPIEVTSVNSGTVTLSNSGGQIAAQPVAAEGGRLVFVDPVKPLTPNTMYTVRVSGLAGADGSEVAPVSFSFTTGSGTGLPESTVGLSFATAGGSAGSEPTPAVWIPTLDWRTGLPPSPWESLPPLHAPKGVTALAGQVLTIDGNALANVTLQIGSRSVFSDGSGRFLLKDIPYGKDALLIDGTSANGREVSFGIFQVGVLIASGRTNVLSYTVWMPVLDTAHAVTVPSPTTSETVISNPLMPGLELHIPAGTIVKSLAGKTVTSIGMTPIPLDRPPFPLPAGVNVPIYFTIQPGGGTLWTTNGQWAWAQLIYPNTEHLGVGAPYNFWNYSVENGWYVYGQGKVVGNSIVPNPGVGIWQFSGAMVANPSTPPKTGNSQGEGGCDPVDCSTGIFRHSESDLRLSDVLPLELTRTYVAQDNTSRPFGIGMTDNYELFLTGTNTPYTLINVILPDGEQVNYTNINVANLGSYQDSLFVPVSAPGSAYYGSTITWNGNGWNLRLKDGTIYQFPDSFGTTIPAQAAMTAIIDRYGNRLTISRDSNSNKTQVTSPNGRWLQFQHDNANRVTQVTDDLGRVVTYNYDADTGVTCNTQNTAVGLLCSVVDANGGVTKYTYDAGNRMLAIVNPRGNTEITNTYDPASGRDITQTLADGSTYQFAYTLNGNGAINQTSITDPNGFVENKSFDSNGFVVTDTYAAGQSYAQQFQYTRDPSTELITSILDPLGRNTDFTYDASGNLTSVTSLAGTTKAVTAKSAYEPIFNQPTSFTDPLGHIWNIAYDMRGNPINVTDPLNHTTSFGFDYQGELTSITDPANETTSLTYNQGDLSSVTDPLGNQSRFIYDNAGRRISSADPLRNQYTFSYDNLDQTTQIVDPNSGSTAFSYDGDGDLLSLTDASGNKTSYTYDSRDRVITRTDPLGKSESYTYDNNSNLTQFTDRRGVVTAYQYDGLDRRLLAGFGQSSPGVYQSKITYTWDAGDRLTKAADSIAGKVTHSYDGLDRLTKETTPQGSLTYAYDKAGRRATMQVAGQPVVSYAYDNANRLTSITQGSSVVGFSYDNVDRRIQLILPNGINLAYTYDNDSRVTAMTWTLGSSQVGNLTYTYDADGGITSKGGSLPLVNLPNAVSGNTFNADNEMTGFNGTTLSYDANGNLLSDGTNTYTWDARNHLKTISGPTPASFAYDALGRRASKTINGAITQFLYDGVNPVQELNGSTPPVPTANLLSGLGVDEYFTRTDSSGTANFLTDILNTTMALTNSSGAISTTHSYDPFGETTVSGANDNPYQFTGRENDGTHLYLYRARYYGPVFDRFIEQDPIGNAAAGDGLFTYGSNDPINDNDPNGLGWMKEFFRRRHRPSPPRGSVSGQQRRLGPTEDFDARIVEEPTPEFVTEGPVCADILEEEVGDYFQYFRWLHEEQKLSAVEALLPVGTTVQVEIYVDENNVIREIRPQPESPSPSIHPPGGRVESATLHGRGNAGCRCGSPSLRHFLERGVRF